MATHSRKDLKVKAKEEKIPHLMNKVAFPKYEYRGKPEAWTFDVWREVYNLPKASLGGYVMKVLKPVRPEHFQHNQLSFYHYAWLAIMDPIVPTLDWGYAVEKTVTRQVKTLGVCNKPTCLGPYLAHLYCHFHEMNNKKMEEPKKRKVLEQSVSDSETEAEE
ncbi:hypothetical protein R1flu_025044 [Riccia fluitans]|uniref:Uncharacterized protein n=1 Tax=Riccia fluitans TaxID=41844 RepID=A0ABD1XWM2_9MARC